MFAVLTSRQLSLLTGAVHRVATFSHAKKIAGTVRKSLTSRRLLRPLSELCLRYSSWRLRLKLL